MAWRSQSDSNEGLIQQLKENGIIKNEMVANAMKMTDRKLYCRVAYPYVDRPHSIGFSATISAPHMHAFALENLFDFIKPGCRILDVGSGSGFLTACFSRLIDAKSVNSNEKSLVIGIEHHPKLVEFSIGNLNSDDIKFIEEGKIKIIQGDGRLGCKEFAPYDCIHVGAAAADIPSELLNQLKPNGRLLCPVGLAGETQQMEQYDKTASGEIMKKTLMSVVYVPLTDLNE
ncbi:hypothetical protein PVAND_006694 [Polypedilum vanderplanki]|uniref:protein-L-isoaspartate(D-aspartate) O-methyltransferase n=1 Tax=Polypedilum vanderplanki TaxID=319348 RepID=S6BNE1_POLVA|nr:hypothetical protein PVAND_006694 [Polypedilum vanderplanki]BAN67564.1 protein L-isoaspartyl methyltransferase [Polypedilum vanderplanki]